MKYEHHLTLMLNKQAENNAKLLAAAPDLLRERDALKVENEALIAWVRKAEHEFNAIRARDGAPQHIDWYNGQPLKTSSCTHEWWNELTEEASRLLKQHEEKQ